MRSLLAALVSPLEVPAQGVAIEILAGVLILQIHRSPQRLGCRVRSSSSHVHSGYSTPRES